MQVTLHDRINARGLLPSMYWERCGPLTLIDAVRAFRRVWAPIEKVLEEAEWADRGFDGGEWGSSYHANEQERAWNDAMLRVAKRFGFSIHELDRAVDVDSSEQYRRWQYAQRARRTENIELDN